MSILLIVFNAAERCPTMAPLFPDHVLLHYRYLRDTLPDLVPVLHLPGQGKRPAVSGQTVVLLHRNSPEGFMAQTLERLSSKALILSIVYDSFSYLRCLCHIVSTC